MATYMNTITEKSYVVVSHNPDGTWIGRSIDVEMAYTDTLLPSLSNGEWVKTSTNCLCDYFGTRDRVEPLLDRA